jgi:hypothetical protein
MVMRTLISVSIVFLLNGLGINTLSDQLGCDEVKCFCQPFIIQPILDFFRLDLVMDFIIPASFRDRVLTTLIS